MLSPFRSSFDVITLGAAVQDIFLRSSLLEETPNSEAPDGLNVCIPFGAKLNVEEMHITSGGGATNAAVTFARYGLKAACICRIGNDQIGANIVDELKRERIGTHFIQKDSVRKTGSSVIILSGAGHRAILTHRGAAGHLSAKEIHWSSLKTKWLYITSVAGDIGLLKHAFGYARKHHVQVAWNPGKAELEEGLRKLSPLFKQTDILIMNREEAACVTELPGRHLGPIFQKLGRYPLRSLVITDGQKGAYAQYKREKEYYFAPIIPADRVNTTGAGDAFGSGVVGALIKELDISEALQVGTLNATGVITHMGAKTGILRHLPTQQAREAVRISRLPLRSL